MARLVTGMFYDRAEAEAAIRALRSQGIPADDIYLEEESDIAEMGSKGGEVSSIPEERPLSALETGALLGIILSFLGACTLYLAAKTMVNNLSANPFTSENIPWALQSPWFMLASMTIIGLLCGALFGWMIDYSINRPRMMSASMPAGRQLLVTVRSDESRADDVYSAMFRSRARRMHMSGAYR